MIKMNGTGIFLIFIVIVFLVINGLLAWAISVEIGKLYECENNQSVFCPVITCNDITKVPGTSQSAGGKKCGSYAWRLIDPDGDASDPDNITCNNP